MPGRVFLAGATAAVIAAVVVGLVTVGGPAAGKREKFDRLRYQDLRTIEAALLCSNWRILQPELPEELTLESLRSYCGGVGIREAQLRDNETGEPYVYSRASADEFSVCATFYDAEKAMGLSYAGTRPGGSFDPETGCVTGRVR